MKIGVFDSGMGGLSIANNIIKQLPDHEVVFVNDKDNMPYGSKSKEQLLELVVPKLNKLIEDGCRVIVIACNTVTTNIINELRKVISVPLVAVEPMVKTASEATKTGNFTVCATPATLSSPRYRELVSEYAKDNYIFEPDCNNWSSMIENNQIDREEIEKVVIQSEKNNSDVIVLACTHYHWIEDMIKELAGEEVLVIQPEQPLIDQLKRVILQLS